MFTPNDIMNKQFNKTMGFGYKIDDVETYLSDVASYVSQMQDEKKDLEKKLEILADKLEEYRQDEDSLRTALLGAQKLGDGVIRESKTKAEIIMRDATIKAEKMVDNAQQKIEMEQIALTRMQKEVASFKNRLLALYKQHLELISALPGEEEEPLTEPVEPAPNVEAPEPQPVKRPVPTPPSEAMPTRAVPPEYLEDEDKEQEDEFQLRFDSEIEEDDREQETLRETAPARGDSRFGPLKFGEGFGLSHEEEELPKKRTFKLDRDRK